MSPVLRLPTIRGLIRRRMLVNFRVDAAAMGRFLPAPFRPKLHGGHAIAGICLIRLERMRPAWLPDLGGIASENAAHRIAVVWDDPARGPREGVYIPRRDTDSRLNYLAGGRIFPGEQHLADFEVAEAGGQIDLAARARDGRMSLAVHARETDALPTSSCFGALSESSAFFEGGSVGYSATSDGCRLDGIRLQTVAWQVRPLAVDRVESSFFADEAAFPAGSVVFDHALLMRNIVHSWHQEADLFTEPADSQLAAS